MLAQISWVSENKMKPVYIIIYFVLDHLGRSSMMLCLQCLPFYYLGYVSKNTY